MIYSKESSLIVENAQLKLFGKNQQFLKLFWVLFFFLFSADKPGTDGNDFTRNSQISIGRHDCWTSQT